MIFVVTYSYSFFFFTNCVTLLFSNIPSAAELHRDASHPPVNCRFGETRLTSRTSPQYYICTVQYILTGKVHGFPV